ncbi:MAG: spore cortex biosynthesis protein YabQ [Oscillospiraceae bacterium]
MEPMQLATLTEIKIILLGLLLGVVLGIAYDSLRILRIIVKHHKAVVFAEDFVYMLLFGFAFFVFSISYANNIRFFVLISVLAGCLAERLLIGNLIIKLFMRIKYVFGKEHKHIKRKRKDIENC